MALGGHDTLVLRDGTCVRVRGIDSGDAPALQRLAGRSSERSIYLRFFGPMKELSDKQARHFAEVDGKDRFALVALDPEDEAEIIGVVRYEREPGTEGSAEYAALIEDRWQGRGLGIGMTRRLIEAARDNGLKRLHALVMHENTGMLHLLRSLDLPEQQRWEDGIEHIEIQLRPDAVA